jgi:hypothetical protein
VKVPAYEALQESDGTAGRMLGALLGRSFGAMMGVVAVSIDSRFKAAVLKPARLG